jgi:type IX secretion system PorP/SprF family membrane protein
MRKAYLFTILLFVNFFTLGQDMQFSQFYASPLYLSPAFAGSSELTRVGVNYRNQWPALDRSFVSFSAYVDHFIEDKNSGIGLVINGSRESLANLQATEVGIVYAYRLRISDQDFLHLGVQGSYNNRSVAFDEVILSTQLDIDRGIIDAGSGNGLPDERKKGYVDLNLGILFTNNKLWLGLSGHHLTQPDVSFLDEYKNQINIKYSAHGGIKFDLKSGFINDYLNNSRQERTLSFAFNYKRQGAFDQLDVGTELFFDPIILGLWYRGLPTQFSLPNNEAIVALFGVTLVNGLDIGYSYDFTISKLGWRNSGGAHELSMKLSFINQHTGSSNRKKLPTFRY